MVWKNTVLDSKTPEETFQHGSDGVEENVEDEQLVHCQNCVLHVEIVSDFIKEESHEYLKTDTLENRYQNLEEQH